MKEYVSSPSLNWLWILGVAFSPMKLWRFLLFFSPSLLSPGFYYQGEGEHQEFKK